MNAIAVELIPTSKRKSFYGKAKVLYVADRNENYLKSYNTIVASVDSNFNVHRHSNYYSATTNQHVKSFLQNYMKNPIETKEFWGLPCESYDSISMKY